MLKIAIYLVKNSSTKIDILFMDRYKDNQKQGILFSQSIEIYVYIWK